MSSIKTRKAKDGSLIWHVRYTYQGTERTKSIGRVRKEDAKREQSRVDLCLLEGKDPDLTSPLRLVKLKPEPVEEPKVITLRGALEKYDKYVSVNGRNQPSTLKSKRRCFGTVPKNLLEKPVAEVEKFDLENWLIEYGQTREPGTVNMANAYMTAVFNWCIDFDMLTKSPMKAIKKAPVEQQPIKALTESQAVELLEMTEGNFHKSVFIALNFGLRSGEIIRLTWEDIDAEHGCIRVVAKRNKTRKARVVPAPNDEVMQKILSWKMHDSLPTDQVVTYKSNNFISAKFRRIRKANGWPEGLSFHSTRHTYITRLQTSGVQIAMVSRLAGHSSVHVTEKYYTHFAHDDLKQAASRLKYGGGGRETENGRETHLTEAA